MSQTCNCTTDTNKMLNEQAGSDLVLALSVHGKSHRVYLATENKKGKANHIMVATYCPFCGAKYDAEPTGDRLIALERRKHRVKGWSAEHDDNHIHGELLRAADVYQLVAETIRECGEVIDQPIWSHLMNDVSHMWPFDTVPDFPKTAEENLVIAGSFYAAEVDRLTRAKAKCQEENVT